MVQKRKVNNNKKEKKKRKKLQMVYSISVLQTHVRVAFYLVPLDFLNHSFPLLLLPSFKLFFFQNFTLFHVSFSSEAEKNYEFSRREQRNRFLGVNETIKKRKKIAGERKKGEYSRGISRKNRKTRRERVNVLGERRRKKEK